MTDVLWIVTSIHTEASVRNPGSFISAKGNWGNFTLNTAGNIEVHWKTSTIKVSSVL